MIHSIVVEVVTSFATRSIRLFLVSAFSITSLTSAELVRYAINAQLDPSHHTIVGHESLMWRNHSRNIVHEIRFHLYLNAFRNQQSTFMQESEGGPPTMGAASPDRGFIDITRLSSGGEDLTNVIQFIHPDDSNTDDQTVAAVSLHSPVRPGQTINLEIDFVSRMPKIIARAGYADDFYMVAQWFPKIGVLEKGRHGAKDTQWNCHQYHRHTEFYSDYGRYDVAVTVPDKYVVAATGVEDYTTKDAQHQLTTHHFHEDAVHDFAWAASPQFVRIEREFRPQALIVNSERENMANLLQLSTSDLQLQPVRMILVLQPDHKDQADLYFRAIQNCLKWYGLWYGAYPYRNITVVDPPSSASPAIGMEYPTLVTAGNLHWGGIEVGTAEDTIFHELGHQYWYGIVGTDEAEEAWLDEGFTTYSAGKLADTLYGNRTFPLYYSTRPLGPVLGLPLVSSDIIDRAVYVMRRTHDPVSRYSWQYYNTASYTVNTYFRAAIVLRTLENYLGRAVMARILRSWFQRNKFSHPGSIDFIAIVNEISKRDMTWFFDQCVFTDTTLNYRVAGVQCSRVEKAHSRQGPDRRTNQYHIIVRLSREGEAVIPIDMKLTLANGDVVREHWDGREPWITYEYTRSALVKSVEIDPERKVLLDMRLSDNSYVSRVALFPFAKWFSNILFLLQALMS